MIPFVRRGIRLLLVEDSPGDAGLVMQMLKRSNLIEADVTHVERISKARGLLHKEVFECVLLDLALPDARGLEALRLVQNAAPDSAVVVLTGYESDDIGIEALQEGAQDFLAKNHVDTEVLGRAILYAVERQRVESTKRHFLDNAAHELRTPLSIISGAAEILDMHREDIEPDRFDELVAVIAKQGKRVGQLLTQLLELSEIDDSKRDEIGSIPLLEAVDKALADAPPPDGKLVERMLEDGLSAWAHPERLQHILVHFLTNAYRYGGNTISIDGRAQNGAVVLGVSDDGPGVPEELVPQLFEPFGRGSLWHPSGSGLGLALCQRMARSFDGRVAYKPQRPHGARFELQLKPA